MLLADYPNLLLLERRGQVATRHLLRPGDPVPAHTQRSGPGENGYARVHRLHKRDATGAIVRQSLNDRPTLGTAQSGELDEREIQRGGGPGVEVEPLSTSTKPVLHCFNKGV